MGYRYICLAADRGCGDEPNSLAESAIRAAGLGHRFTCGSLKLFAARDTPTILLPDGGALVGHVFRRSGEPVDELRLHKFSGADQLCKHLIEDCWGEYLVLQPVASDRAELTIMRDPSGGVPCIYSLLNNAGFITSEISLATDANLLRKQIDWNYITECLTYPHQKTQRTGLLGVSELLPGTTLKVSKSGLSTEVNWNPWDFVDRSHRYASIRDAESEVRRAVSCAVKTWGNLDRSILLEMSGGLDSSIVAACLREAAVRVTCCTLVTPVPGADERQYARLVSDVLGVELHTEMLGFEDARFSFPLLSHTVSPRMGSLQYAIDSVMSAAGARHDAASFFTGAGGDTVFSYLTNATPAADAFRAQGLAGGFAAIRDLCALHQCTVWTAGRLALEKLVQAPKPPRIPRGTFVDSSRRAGFRDNHPWFDAPAGVLPGDLERVFGLAGTQAYRDMAPRGSKRWLRMPLLSQPVMEACLRAPSWMWIRGGRNRAIARSAFADMLPEEIRNRRSKGNFVSYLGGFYKRNRDQIRDFLLEGELQGRCLLDDAALSRFMRQDGLPTRDRSFLEVLDLCMIENWVRQQA